MLKIKALDGHSNGALTDTSLLQRLVEEMEPSTRQKRIAAEFVTVQCAGYPYVSAKTPGQKLSSKLKSTRPGTVPDVSSVSTKSKIWLPHSLRAIIEMLVAKALSR